MEFLCERLWTANAVEHGNRFTVYRYYMFIDRVSDYEERKKYARNAVRLNIKSRRIIKKFEIICDARILRLS